jgi:hypothetical protein
MDEDGARYQQVARLQYAEIERLHGQLNQLRAENQRLISWIMGDEPDALTYLQCTYSDPNASEARRDKCAIGALAYERAKPAATVNNVFSLANYLDQQAQLRKQQAAKVIEHQPTEAKTPWPPPSGQPLDLDAEPAPTILGEGSEPAA